MKAKYTLTTEAIDDEGQTLARCTATISVGPVQMSQGPTFGILEATAKLRSAVALVCSLTGPGANFTPTRERHCQSSVPRLPINRAASNPYMA